MSSLMTSTMLGRAAAGVCGRTRATAVAATIPTAMSETTFHIHPPSGRALHNPALTRHAIRSRTSSGNSIKNNDESQRDDVCDCHHVEARGEGPGPVSKNSQHLWSEVNKQAGAETD